MKSLDRFLLHDLGKLFHSCSVAFYIDDIQPYNKAMASIRIRCYDIMNYLEQQGIRVELYKPFRKYDVVIFTKTRSEKAVRLARKLHQQGIPIYYEAYCEYLEDPSRADDWERVNILKIVEQADMVGTCSEEQRQAFSNYHPHVVMIPESVHDAFFEVEKKHEKKEHVTLVYCGYSAKAKDTLCIEAVLKRMQQEYGCRLLYLCEKDPGLPDLTYDYLLYDQRKIPQLLLEGDIMIAPRPMEGIEKLAHSFTKVAYPLAVGLPAVASPVPSYVDTPVILCRNEEEWMAELVKLAQSVEERSHVGTLGREYVRQHYSLQVVGEEYRRILEKLCKTAAE